MSKLFRSLRESSIEAIVLSLEIINKLSISYRLQTFAFLFCNAWELLLKAKLVADKRKIFYRKKRGKARLSLSLDDCLAGPEFGMAEGIPRFSESTSRQSGYGQGPILHTDQS